MDDFIERLTVFTKLYGKYFFLLIIIILFFAAAVDLNTPCTQPKEELENALPDE